LTILAGRPKIGKSGLALNIAIAVASGGLVFGSVQVETGSVLYLALVDTQRRLQSRLEQVLGDDEWPDDLDTLRRNVPGLTKVLTSSWTSGLIARKTLISSS